MPPHVQPTSFPLSGTIIPWSAALRSKPSTQAHTLADLPRGESVKVILRAQGWLYVESKTRVKGYVSGELIKPAALPSPAPVPQKTKKEWQRVALQNAFGPTLAQQIARKAAWIPEKGFAANQQIIAKLYDYYGALYRRHPGKFQWAGLARMAGGPFYQGFCDMEKERAIAQTRVDWLNEHYILATLSMRRTAAADLAAMATATNLKQALELLMHMGQDIFNDLAWLHEAYLASGLTELKRLLGLGAITPAYYSAWELIDSTTPEKMWQGNSELLRFEQRDILKVGYMELQKMPLVPTIMSALANSPHPWGKSFYAYHSVAKGREVTHYNARWEWLEKNIWPTWKAQTEAARTRLINLSLAALGARKF
ncbi:SH3 domain-containing protein [Archangium sp.]|uniref:SH3 domain-containing protein n=1 Tax=Archangium sp. TaxID=1872627 RepID=UPI00286ABBA9|nr:SH3 domain-containing protein [Archangium sp.]